MKKATKAIAAVGTAIVVLWLAVSVCGCGTVSFGNSDTVEFPVQEKWWK